jgi:glycosyltransferase involved in cell wall biosynthesis
MRLLMLMRDHLPPFRPDVAVLFGRELHKLGVHTDLLGQAAAKSEASRWPAGELWLSGRERPGLLGDLLRPLFDLPLLWRLQAGHGLVQVRDKIRSALLVRAWSRLRGKPWVYWMSFPIAEGLHARSQQLAQGRRGPSVWLLQARAALAMRLFYRHVAPCADHLFVQSHAMLEFMAAKGVARQRMTAVPMGVDAFMLAQVQPLAERPAHLQGRRLVVYLGALGRARNPQFLLEALAALRLQEPAALLLLVGDAASQDERDWLRACIKASGQAEHVHLTGWMPQSEALRWVASAELGWSPVPRGELFDVSSPTKAVEYLGLGLPCVGNDIPDQQRVLSQSGGGVCVPMEAAAFAAASASLLADPTRAKAMGRSGQAWVARHRDYAVLAAEVAAVYRQLLGHSNPSGH